MNSILRALGQILISTLLLFLGLEVIFHFIGAPGGSRFSEKIIIQESFNSHKPKGEYRIFAYGESTMQGSHYGSTSNPTKWLEAYLKDFLPDKKIRVVNFARVGHGSDFAYQTFKDSLFYKPDLVIFYLGHNDFLTGNLYSDIQKEQATVSFQLRKWIRQSYFLSTLSRWVVQKRMALNKEKSDDRLEYEKIETPPLGVGVANPIHRKDPRYSKNIDFFKTNILKILDLGKKRSIPLLFLKPVCNLKDFAPFSSVHMKELSPDKLLEWKRWYQEGKVEEVQSNTEEALNFYAQAYAIDNTYAELSFRLGQIYFKRGDYPKARNFFEEARDNDAVIFRATDDILKVYEDLARERGLQLLDTEKIVISEIPSGIMGEPVIEDNVHFSLRGHSLLGKALAQVIADQNWIAPKNEWKFEQERSFDAISDNLGLDQEFLIGAYLKMINYFGSRYDNRIRLALKVLEMDPTNARGIRYLAWSYWLAGEKENAMAIYQRLDALHPNDLEEVFKSRPEIKRYWSETVSDRVDV